MERADLPSERDDDDAQDHEEDPLCDEGRGPPLAHRIVQVGCFRSSMNWINGLPSSAKAHQGPQLAIGVEQPKDGEAVCCQTQPDPHPSRSVVQA